MEQDSKKSGSSNENLNPMFYWKWVLKNRGGRITPRAITIDLDYNTIKQLVKNHPEVDFSVFDTDLEEESPLFRNVLFCERGRKTDTEYYTMLSEADYFYSNDNRLNLEAGLCGVKSCSTIEELEANLQSARVLTKIERIENWESAKNLLTRKNSYVIL